MTAQTEEWSNSIIRLTALASRLEGEGYYNVAKLARAAADSLCRQAARQVTLPADHDRLAEEIESLSASLSRLGVDNSLIQALERGRQALSEGRLPMGRDAQPFRLPDRRPYGGRSAGLPVPGLRRAGRHPLRELMRRRAALRQQDGARAHEHSL